MLSLTRRIGQEVVVTLPDGREMIVKVLTLAADKVRLGFAAPADVKIMRTELLDAGRTEPPRRDD
jgi:carbon storage regulator CsrA